jgi:hypothetical protein
MNSNKKTSLKEIDIEKKSNQNHLRMIKETFRAAPPQSETLQKSTALSTVPR